MEIYSVPHSFQADKKSFFFLSEKNATVLTCWSRQHFEKKKINLVDSMSLIAYFFESLI